MVNYIPDRGEIIWINFEPQKGKEIKKTRPALVISPLKYNQKTGLLLCMPVTSNIKGYPFEVKIDEKQIKGAILCDQVRSFDWRERKAEKIIALSSDQLHLALDKLKLLIKY